MITFSAADVAIRKPEKPEDIIWTITDLIDFGNSSRILKTGYKLKSRKMMFIAWRYSGSFGELKCMWGIFTFSLKKGTSCINFFEGLGITDLPTDYKKIDVTKFICIISDLIRKNRPAVIMNIEPKKGYVIIHSVKCVDVDMHIPDKLENTDLVNRVINNHKEGAKREEKVEDGRASYADSGKQEDASISDDSDGDGDAESSSIPFTGIDVDCTIPEEDGAEDAA